MAWFEIRKAWTFVFCVTVLTVTVNARLKRGKYEFLESFCTGPEIYVAIPWDCTGYVHCSNLGSQRDAYWIECPTNLFYSMEAQTCMWPKDMSRPCPHLKDVIENYCIDHPNIRFQNPDHCAQYYDCRDASFTPGLGPYLKECPFPQLYNPSTNMCGDRMSVNCYDRFTPTNKCDYVQHAGSGANCEAISTPGCHGMPDGPNPYPNRLLSVYYLMCQANKTVSTQTCTDGLVFDPIKLTCTKDIDRLSIEIYCAQHMNDKIAHPANCARYIDCRPTALHPELGRHQGECTYPQLYSTLTSTCENFEQVQCTTRYEPKAPCEYASTIGGGSMQNCMATFYSCVGLPDGPNVIPGGGINTKYIMCQSDRTVEVKTCPNGNTYDPVAKICSQTAEMGLVARQCSENPYALVPDPDNCARYFNCSQTINQPSLVKYQTECDYPLLFNTLTMACDDFDIVNCGTRMEPKAPCDYLSTTTKCEGPLCALPCLERSPSCVGMLDGNNTYPARDLSPFYMTCLGERTQTVGICRFGVYDPTLRACTTELDPISIEEFCSKNPTGIIPHYTNCARYYNCSSAALMSGGNSYLQECLYPQLFNLDAMTCDPYQAVQCTFRFEPKGPCEYLQNQVCPDGQPNCLPCEQRIPSCNGLENGNNSFVGRDNFYIVCQDERTLYVRECVGGKFDPLSRSCKAPPPGPEFEINRPSKYCAAYPTDVVASPLSCAQYFDCSAQVTALGPYKKECPYPQLFDPDRSSCLPYDIVNCKTRFEPTDPCEYEANLKCPETGPCLPCRDRFASCKGSANGNFSVPKRPSEYKICRDGRTIEVRQCAGNGVYDEALGGCQISFDPANPVPFCTVYPNALLSNPNNCAQFYDCRQRSTMFGNYLRECPYLQLYSESDKTCHTFDKVICGSRPEPKAPCEYLQNQQCYEPAGCPPCEKMKPSCIGLPNGNNTFPGRVKEYLVCAAERTLSMEICEFDYDPKRRRCGQDMSNPNIFCAVLPTDVLMHSTRCAQYYDCSKPNSRFGEMYLQECPYPSLFDPKTKACLDFTEVTCGERIEPKSPCDYMANGCQGQGPGCLPCTERFVSCVGRPDGNNSYPGQEMTLRYAVCQTGRTVGEGMCRSGYFDPVRRICAVRLDSVSIQLFCQQNKDVILANPLNCAQYFDCSAQSVAEGTFLRECPYPMLFSSDTLVCQTFPNVTCGLRMEPKEPCQYLQNVCDPRQPGCIPCQQKFPSCAALPDGDNAYPGRPLMEDYIKCLKGRTVGTFKCTVGVFFPDRRECNVVLDEQMATQYCKANPTKILAHQTNCAQYYDCRQAVGGSFLRECRYPQLFLEANQTCRNFSDVDCGARMEPQAPCEYLQTQCLQNAVNCTPCPERLPSCIGLPDGNNAFPSRPSSQYYVKCFKNRTVAVEVCQVSLFDPGTRECSNVIDASVLSGFCQENPTVLIPDPLHCARYYNCSDPSLVQGLGIPHLQECKYPRLFGYGATNCELFTEIPCETRYEPKAPCEYVENQCFNATCKPCSENYPSCVGLQDGSNTFPGREGTEYYIVCYKDRTVAIVTCTSDPVRNVYTYYNHATRSCEAVDPNTGAVGGSVKVI